MANYKRNNVNCDIYIGTGCGAQLIEAIDSACKSVDIVTPYISIELLNKLLKLAENSIKVRIIAGDSYHGFGGIISKDRHTASVLIRQEQHTDDDEQKRWVKLKRAEKYFWYGSFVLSAALAVGWLATHTLHFVWGIPALLIFLAVAIKKRLAAASTRVFSYTYVEPISFKVFEEYKRNSNSRATTIHSKIYVIDEKIAYLGSLNFTASGTEHNCETRVKTTDEGAAAAIMQDIDRLFKGSFDNAHLVESDLKERWKKCCIKNRLTRVIKK